MERQLHAPAHRVKPALGLVPGAVETNPGVPLVGGTNKSEECLS